MIWLFDHGGVTAYHEVWCSNEMRRIDPEECSVGLAIGYGWVPAVLLLTLATLAYLVSRAYGTFRGRRH